MLTVALSSGATTGTARRGWRGGLPHSSGTFLRGRFFGHTHTLVEDGMGSPPFSRTSRQRQPGGEAPARAGARSPEHGLERGGVTTPQAREGSSISRSPQSTTQSPQPTTSQSRPPALHRIPDSPKQQQPLRRALARNDVARAASSQDEMVLSGSGSGAARRLRNTPAAAAPTLPFGPLELQQQPPVAVVVVIPEGGGAKPPLPSMTGIP